MRNTSTWMLCAAAVMLAVHVVEGVGHAAVSTAARSGPVSSPCIHATEKRIVSVVVLVVTVGKDTADESDDSR